MRTRTFVVIGLLATLLVAGVASYYASSHPDGLEYVAEKAGFADTAEDSAAADSPLSDYQVKGVENDAVSGGLAGVIGALIVLGLATGVAYAVHRKGVVDRVDAAEHAATPDRAATDERATEDRAATDHVPDERLASEQQRKGG